MTEDMYNSVGLLNRISASFLIMSQVFPNSKLRQALLWVNFSDVNLLGNAKHL